MILKVRELKKNFATKYAISDISFEIKQGEIFALIGSNGAGKTTTMRCLYDIASDGGSIEVFGGKLDLKAKKRIAIMTEDRRTFKNFSGADYLKMYSLLYEKWNDKVFSNFALHYKFDMKQKLNTYSIGTKTMFFLALTISSGADFIILDEPTQHLDPIVRNNVLTILKQFVAEEGKTVLISSHEIYELEEIASSFAIIKEGRVVYTSSMDDAKDEHRVLAKGETISGNVIGLINDETLVKTNQDFGRYPTLNEIVLGYLNKSNHFSPFQ